jgi:hypothetical protein
LQDLYLLLKTATTADYFTAGGPTLQCWGSVEQFPLGHITPEQQTQDGGGDGEIPKRLSGGGTSVKAPVQFATTGSGAPMISAVNTRKFGSTSQIWAPST